MNKKAFAIKSIGITKTLGLATISAGFLCQTANAQLTQNITMGNPKALALGHAVTADPPGIDSIHFNPAGLAKIKGRQRQVKLLAAQITFDAQFGPAEIPDDTKTALCSVTEGCDVNNETDVQNVWPEDTFLEENGRKSSTSDPVLMLPGSGLTSVPFLVVPIGGIAVQDPDYGWTMATAAYSPMAIGYERDVNDPATFQGEQIGISRITYFSPSIGLKFNDELMFGASIGFSWQGLGIKTKFRAPEPTIAFIADAAKDITGFAPDLLRSISPYDTIGTLTLEMEDALSLSFNLGVLWEPTDWLAFGAVYQSESKSNLKGDYKMEYTGEFGEMASSLHALNILLGPILGNDIRGPSDAGNIQTCLDESLQGNRSNCEYVEKGDIEMEFIVPQHVSLGTSVNVLPDLKVNFDVKWTDYKAWESLDFTFDPAVDFLTVADLVYRFRSDDNADPDEMRIPRDYVSEISWALGIEYQYDDNIVLRFGYEPRGSAVPDNKVDLLAPIADATLYSFGAGYQLDKFSRVDFAMAWLNSEFDAAAGESDNANSNSPGHVVYNPYAGIPISAQTNAYIFALSYDTKF